MRMIGSTADERSARLFADYLLTLNIKSHIEPGAAGWLVWVEHDDHLDRAKAELEQFTRDPGAPQYSRSGSAAAGIRKLDYQRQERMRRNFTDVRTNWSRVARGSSPVTTALVVICVIVAAASLFGMNDQAVNPLRITPATYDVRGDIDGHYRLDYTLKRGEVWRLVTPIVIHYGVIHLFFNMSMLLNLGGAIEMRRGRWTFIVLVLASAIPSNLAQYFWSGPYFGGMSGVVYALFGYVWMKSKFQPYLGIRIDPGSVVVMFAWLFACMTGFLGPIANTAHVVGLIMGVLIGITPHLWNRLRRRTVAP